MNYSPLLYTFGEIVRVVANLCVAAGFIFIYLQFRSDQRDRESNRDDEQIRRFYYLHTYLAAKHFADARYHIRKMPLKKNTHEDLDDTDKDSANLVCSSYDQAGLLLLETGLFKSKWRKKFLDSSWCESICQQYEILLKLYLKDEKIGTKNAETYFKHFRSLYDEAKKLRI